MGGILEDKILKVTFRNFLNIHLSTIVLMLVGFGILCYLRFDQYFVQVFVFFWMLDLLPAVYLHLSYLSKNKGEEYEVRDTELVWRKGGEKKVYKNHEIEKIIIHLSPALYRNSNFHLLAIESYHYAVVKLKTGEELILTCLLAPRIDKSLKKMKGVLFEKRKRLFCMFISS
ncbi:MAG: hypothetical protein P8I82_02095 [Flavobacteriales bacterium]|nr:hypothetical protein [Flavobacteriales bacterium]